MSISFLTNFNESEFKAFLKEAIREILLEKEQVNNNAIPEILNIHQVSQLLDLKVSTIYEKTSLKLIPHFKKGGKLLFMRSDIQNWIKEGKVKTTNELEEEAASYNMKKRFNKGR